MNRTAEVKRLFLAGKNIDEICEELELNDREKRHQAAAIIRKTKQGLNIGYRRPGVGDRGEEITRLRLSGKSINEISKLTGLSAGQIEYYFRCNNIKKPQKLPKPKELSPRIEKQRKDDACVRELLAQGKGVKEIVEEVGVSKNFVYRRARELGIKFAKCESHEDIAELRRSGKSVSEICKITGKNRKVVSDKCKEIGLRETEEEIAEFYRELSIRNRHSEEWARGYISKKSNGVFEYISGYINMDSPVVIRCVKCGDVTKKAMGTFRNGNNHPCIECQKQETQMRVAERAKAKAEVMRIAKEKKEDARRIKACSGKQITLTFCKSCGLIMCGRSRANWCDDCRRKHENKNKDISRRIKIKNACVDSDIDLDSLLRRDGYVCHICGGLCDKNDFIMKNGAKVTGNNYPSIDHVVPLAKGGLHSWNNVKVAHRICNSLKGDSYDEIEMEKSNNQSHDECRNISRLLR